MEEKKIQFEGISDEETWKLFSWFEKLINQTETKKVVRFLDFVNKKPDLSWKELYKLSFFAQNMIKSKSNSEWVDKDFLFKRINKLYNWWLESFMTHVYLTLLLQWKETNVSKIIEETLKKSIRHKDADPNLYFLFDEIYREESDKTFSKDDWTDTEQIFIKIDIKKWKWLKNKLANKTKKELEDYLIHTYDNEGKNFDLFKEVVETLIEEYNNFLNDKNRKFVFTLWNDFYYESKTYTLRKFLSEELKKLDGFKVFDVKKIKKLILLLMSNKIFLEKTGLEKQEFKILILRLILGHFHVRDDAWDFEEYPKKIKQYNGYNFSSLLLDKEFMSDFNEEWKKKIIKVYCDYYAEQLEKIVYESMFYYWKYKINIVDLWRHTFWEELINQPWWEFIKEPINLLPQVFKNLYDWDSQRTPLINNSKEKSLSEYLSEFFPNDTSIEEKKKKEKQERKEREAEERRQEALKEIEKKKEEFERENQKLKKRQEKIKLELAWDKEYNNFIKKVLSKKIDISKLEVEVFYIPYWEDTLDTKIWRVSSEILNKKTTPVQFATYYKILKVFENMSEPLEDFIYSMRRRYEVFQADKKLFEKVFREHLTDVYFLTKEEQDVIIWEMKRMFWDEWAFIDAFYAEFMPDLISCEFSYSQDEACFPASIKRIQLLNKFESFDDEYEEDEYEEDKDEEEDEKELQELKERQKRVKEKIDNDKWFQDIIKKILSKKIDISKMDICIHVIPYWEDTLDTKSLKVSQKLINSETTPLLFVTYLKILKVLQRSSFDELEEFFSSMLKKLERYELNDWFEKKFREHLSDVYFLTKEEQDALLKSLVFDWHIKYAYDFYEYFMEEFVGKVYTSYMDWKCFPSSIEEIDLVENNKSIRL